MAALTLQLNPKCTTYSANAESEVILPSEETVFQVAL